MLNAYFDRIVNTLNEIDTEIHSNQSKLFRLFREEIGRFVHAENKFSQTKIRRHMQVTRVELHYPFRLLCGRTKLNLELVT